MWLVDVKIAWVLTKRSFQHAEITFLYLVVVDTFWSAVAQKFSMLLINSCKRWCEESVGFFFFPFIMELLVFLMTYLSRWVLKHHCNKTECFLVHFISITWLSQNCGLCAWAFVCLEYLREMKNRFRNDAATTSCSLASSSLYIPWGHLFFRMF